MVRGYDNTYNGTGLPRWGSIVENISDQWNKRSGCYNELCYYIPYESGDVIVYQLQNENFCLTNWDCNSALLSTLKINVRNCCDDTILYGYTRNSPEIGYTIGRYGIKDYKWQTGFSNYQCFQNISIYANICGCCNYTYGKYFRNSEYIDFTGFVTVFTNAGAVVVDVALPQSGFTVNVIQDNYGWYVEIVSSICTFANAVWQMEGGGEQFSLGSDLEQKYNCVTTGELCFYIEFVLDGQVIGYSQQYKCVGCKETSVLFNAQYNNKLDCNNTYYGEADSSVISCKKPSYGVNFINIKRVTGEFKHVSIEIENKLTENCSNISSTTTDIYEYNSGAVPYFVANELGAIFASYRMLIENVEYKLKDSVKIDRLTIKGINMYSVSAKLYQCPCIIQHNCVL